MIEVYPRLYIGAEIDYEMTVCNQDDWWVVHACKEPYHRQLLGYRGRGAPKDHPEYLVAKRGKRMYLNLVDADDPAFIPKEAIDAGLEWIDNAFKSGECVLVHCNQGESRSPAIGLLYLASHTGALPCSSLYEAEASFRQLYPLYKPKRGIRGFLSSHWNLYT